MRVDKTLCTNSIVWSNGLAVVLLLGICNNLKFINIDKRTQISLITSDHKKHNLPRDSNLLRRIKTGQV